MSERSHLIPNLNKMMEAYTEVKEDSVQETQSREMQAEERVEDRGELGSIEEESRKRKMRAKETKTEQRAKKLRNFISYKAAALMEKSLKDRGFIAERGFKNLISHFVEILENREWQALGKHKEPGCAALVKEFFANMVEKKGNRVYVRGHWIDFNKERINMLFNLKV